MATKTLIRSDILEIVCRKDVERDMSQIRSKTRACKVARKAFAAGGISTGTRCASVFPQPQSISGKIENLRGACNLVSTITAFVHEILSESRILIVRIRASIEFKIHLILFLHRCTSTHKMFVKYM